MMKLFRTLKNILWKDPDNEDEVLIPMKGKDIYLYL